MRVYEEIVDFALAKLKEEKDLEHRIFQLAMAVAKLKDELHALETCAFLPNRPMRVGSRVYRIVLFLALQEEPVPMRTIREYLDGNASERTCMTKSNLDELIEKGIVERRASQDSHVRYKWLFSLSTAAKKATLAYCEDFSI